MPVTAVGLSHRSTPISVLERLVLRGDAYAKADTDLMSRPSIREAVVVSTCLRTEVYVVADRFHQALGDIRSFFTTIGGLAPQDFIDSLEAWYEEDAVRHVFRLAAGMESAVVGETEVLGQLRGALETAQEHGAAGPVLERLITSGLIAGRAVRTQTAISRGTASMSHAAVEAVAAHLHESSHASPSVVVVGAGEMGTAVVKSLRSTVGHAEVAVTNRDVHRANATAAEHGVAVRPWHELHDATREVDVIVTTTAADEVLFTFDDIEDAVARRSGRPLLLVDLALPRNIDSGVIALDGVTLVDLELLATLADRARAQRLAEVPQAEELIEEAVDRYAADRESREIAPVVAALYERAEGIRAAELARHRARLGELTDEQREAVDVMLRAVTQKLLHEPVATLKDAAGSRNAPRLLAAARELYGL